MGMTIKNRIGGTLAVYAGLDVVNPGVFGKPGNNLALIPSDTDNNKDIKKALAGKSQAKAYLSMF